MFLINGINNTWHSIVKFIYTYMLRLYKYETRQFTSTITMKFNYPGAWISINKYHFSHSLQIMCKFNSLVHVHENYGTPSFLHPNLLIKSYIPKIIYMYWTKMMDALGKHHLQKSMYSDVEALNYPSTKVAIYGKSWVCRCLSLSLLLSAN